MRTSPRARSFASLSFGALVVASLGEGCAAKAPTALMVAIQSEMATPSEIDGFELEVTRGDSTPFYQYYAVGKDGDAALPGTLALSNENDSAGKPVTVVIRAKLGSKERVLRRATLGFSEGKTKLLRMPLRYSCADFPDICPPGQSCKGGACQSDQIDVEALPDFVQEEVFGEPGSGTCFDDRETACFAGRKAVDVAAATSSVDCSVTLDGAATNLNVALRWGTSADTVLDRDEREGWIPTAGGFRLSAGLCDALKKGKITAISYATACPPKGPEVPTCRRSGADAGTGGGGSGGAVTGGGGGSGKGGAGTGAAGSGGAGASGKAGAGAAGAAGTGGGGGGTGGTGGTGGAPCASSGPPVGADRAVSLTLTGVDLGDASGAWSDIGFDIDNRCTVATSTNVCTGAPGAPSSVRVDGTLGIDNSYGRTICPIVNGLSSKSCSSGIPSIILSTDAAGNGSMVLSSFAGSSSPVVFAVRDVYVVSNAKGGMIGGVMPTTALVTAVKGVAGCIASSFCSGSTIDAVVAQFQAASDIAADGSNGADVACDGVSFGLSFTGSSPFTGSLPMTATCCP